MHRNLFDVVAAQKVCQYGSSSSTGPPARTDLTLRRPGGIEEASDYVLPLLLWAVAGSNHDQFVAACRPRYGERMPSAGRNEANIGTCSRQPTFLFPGNDSRHVSDSAAFPNADAPGVVIPSGR